MFKIIFKVFVSSLILPDPPRFFIDPPWLLLIILITYLFRED
jgi:hypothetical protein